jgi:hypothetical protein
MMNSCERVKLALEHKEPDMVPLDLGGTPVTGIHVDSVYLLRQALHLDPPGTPVKVIDPFEMLGDTSPDLLAALGVDVVGLGMRLGMFGFPNEGWKPWTTFAGTPVLVPAGFNTEPEPNGDILMYPQGDMSVPASGRMPRGGHYFDGVIRQPPIDDDHLNVDDNVEEFTAVTEDDLSFLESEITRVAATGKAVIGTFDQSRFGDIAWVPGLNMKHPKGIRDVEEWYVSTHARRDYIYEVFERQCEIGLQNLARIYAVVGDRVTATFVTGTDFGAQNGPFISPKAYRELYKPFHLRVNKWIHANTKWKSFIHSCGSVWRLLDDFVDAGFDCVNPVQTSAAEMDPVALKTKYGNQVTFWGGGVDTQKVLPFGSPDDVRAMVRERMKIFGPGGGFVFAVIHNVQSGIPIQNLLALIEAVNEYRGYPMRDFVPS